MAGGELMDEPGTKKRPVWGLVQYLGVITCFIGYRMIAVFPGHIYTKTGAALIPYYMGLLVVVIPIVYVQMRLGGSTQKNIISLLSKYCPILKGVGVANVIRIFILTVYFNVLVAYSIYYAFASLSFPHTWGRCDQDWAPATCDNVSFPAKAGRFESEALFFEREALQISPNISEEGTIPWHMGVCLLAAWILTFLSIFLGMRWFSWVMTFLGGCCGVVSIALLAYGREEVEHGNPDKAIYKADWNAITKPSVLDAFLNEWMGGVFEAIMLAKAWDGVLPTVGKYCGKGRTVTNTRWLFLIVFLAIAPHLFINIIAPYMGALAQATDLNLEDTMIQGPHLLYVLFPAAFHHLQLKRGISFVFFFVVFIFTSQAQSLWTITAVDNIVDGVSNSKRKLGRKFFVFMITSAIYCVAGLVLGIPLITEGGLYVVILIDKWHDRLICILIFFSLIALTVSYAKQRYHLANKVIFILWFLLASLFVTAVTIYKANFHNAPEDFVEDVKFRQPYTFPNWAYVLGWFIAAGPIVVGLVFGAMHAVAAAPGTGCSKLANAYIGGSERRGSSRKKHKRLSAEGGTEGL